MAAKKRVVSKKVASKQTNVSGARGLNPKCFGLAGGSMWGVGFLLTTWLATLTGWGSMLMETWGSLYPGYDVSFLGGVIGGIFGFVDGFIMAFVVAWLYNMFLKKYC